MLLPLSMFLAPGLVLPLPLFLLSSTCGDFTVAACSPDTDEFIDSFDSIASATLCQGICQLVEGCSYFRHSGQTQLCDLYSYSYLASCRVIAGPPAPGIDACSDGTKPSCDQFTREDCTYLGAKVLETHSITDSHACQELLLLLGAAYGAEYFSFDRRS